MKLFKRLLFAIKFDIEQEFIVDTARDQLAMRFVNYEDAKKFTEAQIQYRPKIMVGVTKL